MNYEDFFAWLSQGFSGVSPFGFIVGVVTVCYVFSRLTWLFLLYSGDVLYSILVEFISRLVKQIRKAKDKR